MQNVFIYVAVDFFLSKRSVMFSPEFMKFLINYQKPEYKPVEYKQVKYFKFKFSRFALAFLLNRK